MSKQDIYKQGQKKLRLHNVNNLEMCLKDQALNKKYIAEKYDYEILR